MISHVRWGLIGAFAAILACGVVSAAYVFTMTDRCLADEIALSAWTSTNRDPTFPAHAAADCSPWANALRVVIPAAMGAGAGLVGVGTLEVRARRATT